MLAAEHGGKMLALAVHGTNVRDVLVVLGLETNQDLCIWGLASFGFEDAC